MVLRENGSSSSLQTMQLLRQKAQNLKLLAEKLLAERNLPIPPPPLASLTNTSIPSLNLPFPEEIESSLRTLDLSRDRLDHILHKLHNRALRVQEIYNRNFEQACRELSQVGSVEHLYPSGHIFIQLSQVYEKSYNERFSLFLTKYVSALCSRRNATCIRAKPAFNNQYTPLLEQYFEANPYPSTADRLVLAQKTMMTPRQIEVWFQNHRNRAKQNGKVLQRATPSQAFELPHVKAFGTSVSPTLKEARLLSDEAIPVWEHMEAQHQSRKVLTDNPPLSNQTAEFSNISPPHAFPTPFSSSSRMNPFPNDNGVFKFAPPQWHRHPSRHSNAYPEVNMEDLVKFFAAKLDLRRCSDGKQRQVRKSRTNSRRWYQSRITTPCPAPHPALIQIVSLAQFHPRPTAPPRPISPPPEQEASLRRKAAFLPKRTPSTNPTKFSPSILSNPNSRCPSLISELSSRSRTTSTSSISSLGPTTPPLLASDPTHSLWSESDFGLLDELLLQDFQLAIPPLQDVLTKPMPSSLLHGPSPFLFPPFYDLIPSQS